MSMKPFDSADYTVRYINVEISRPYLTGPEDGRKGYQECGQDLFCGGTGSAYSGICGNWAGNVNSCCYAEIRDETVSFGGLSLEPCNFIPEIQGKDFDQIGTDPIECSKDATEYGVRLPPQNVTSPRSEDRCCPKYITTYLVVDYPDPKNYFGTSRSEYRCGNFTITQLAPRNGNGTFNVSGDGPSPSGTGDDSSATKSDPTNTAQTTPNSAPRGTGSSKLSSFLVGSVILAMFVGSQL